MGLVSFMRKGLDLKANHQLLKKKTREDRLNRKAGN